MKENQDAVGWSPTSSTPTRSVGRWRATPRSSAGSRTPTPAASGPRWWSAYPGEIPDPGGIRTQFHHAIDITPTAPRRHRHDPPDAGRRVEQEPLHGESLRYVRAARGPHGADRCST